MAVCIFCGGECGRVCRGLGFKRTEVSSKKARNDSGGGRESGPATHVKSQPGPKKALLGREVAPVKPNSSAGVTPGPPETTKLGRPRIGEEREKPWLKCKPPMSERTWYRRRQTEKRSGK